MTKDPDPNFASDQAGELAAQHKEVNLKGIKGSGKDGALTVADVRDAVEKHEAANKEEPEAEKPAAKKAVKKKAAEGAEVIYVKNQADFREKSKDHGKKYGEAPYLFNTMQKISAITPANLRDKNETPFYVLDTEGFREAIDAKLEA